MQQDKASYLPDRACGSSAHGPSSNATGSVAATSLQRPFPIGYQ